MADRAMRLEGISRRRRGAPEAGVGAGQLWECKWKIRSMISVKEYWKSVFEKFGVALEREVNIL